jgi:hypothetical protein
MNRAQHPLYQRWYHIIRRVEDPNFPDYHYAGARGLKVYRAWYNFDNFAKWFEENLGLPTDRYQQIARKNPNIGWIPSNIELEYKDHRTISNNRTTNHPLTYKGRTQTLAEWSRELGLGRGTLFTRLSKGWKPGEALGYEKRNRGGH